jgi:hypothetical protein
MSAYRAHSSAYAAITKRKPMSGPSINLRPKPRHDVKDQPNSVIGCCEEAAMKRWSWKRTNLSPKTYF